jgi:hypothetical protein
MEHREETNNHRAKMENGIIYTEFACMSWWTDMQWEWMWELMREWEYSCKYLTFQNKLCDHHHRDLAKETASK